MQYLDIFTSFVELALITSLVILVLLLSKKIDKLESKLKDKNE